MNLSELVMKLIPITPNERKCALDKQLREHCRADATRLINEWFKQGCQGAVPMRPDSSITCINKY
jgi:hypothetical protein